MCLFCASANEIQGNHIISTKKSPLLVKIICAIKHGIGKNARTIFAKFEIMVGFWSRAIALSDFKNFWFFELSVSSRTTMSPSTFLYLVKKSFEIMVGFWSRAIALSDLETFCFFELSVSS